MCVCERVVVGVCVSVGHESFKRKGGEREGREDGKVEVE